MVMVGKLHTLPIPFKVCTLLKMERVPDASLYIGKRTRARRVQDASKF